MELQKSDVHLVVHTCQAFHTLLQNPTKTWSFPCADPTNAALATSAGLNVPAIQSSLSSLSSQVTNGQSAAIEAQDNVQGQGIVVSSSA